MKNSFRLSFEIRQYPFLSCYCVNNSRLVWKIYFFTIIECFLSLTCVKSIPAQTFQEKEGNWLNKYRTCRSKKGQACFPTKYLYLIIFVLSSAKSCSNNNPFGIIFIARWMKKSIENLWFQNFRLRKSKTFVKYED